MNTFRSYVTDASHKFSGKIEKEKCNVEMKRQLENSFEGL